MKKIFYISLLWILAACSAQNKYSDFDYSYARSGGKSAIYENFLIKGNTVHYSFESPEKKISKDFKISNDDLKNIETVLTDNNFRTIQEDYKKVYDHVSTSIGVKSGVNSGRKSDASFIMVKDQKRWEAVKSVFQKMIEAHSNSASSQK